MCPITSARPVASVKDFNTPASAKVEDLAQLQQQALDRWSERLQQHASEPIDAAWSRTAALSPSEDLRSAEQQQPFHIIDTQCRSSSCSALVEWPSYHSAADSYAALLHQMTQLNCVRQIVLPQPARRDSAYQANGALRLCGATRAITRGEALRGGAGSRGRER